MISSSIRASFPSQTVNLGVTTLGHALDMINSHDSRMLAKLLISLIFLQ